METKSKCKCTTKYCEHYESDFDKFVKNNPLPTEDSWEGDKKIKVIELLKTIPMMTGSAYMKGIAIKEAVEKAMDYSRTATITEIREAIKNITTKYRNEPESFIDGMKAMKDDFINYLDSLK